MESVFSTVVTSAVIATVVGATINAWLDARKTQSSTRFDALRAAIALEGYAITCAERIADHETAVSSDGHAGSFMGNVPTLPELTVVAGFLRPRKASVANRLLMLPQEIRQADQVAEFWWDVVGDEDAARNAATLHTATLAIQALALASDVRTVFGLPTRDLVFGAHDVREFLEERRVPEALGEISQ